MPDANGARCPVPLKGIYWNASNGPFEKRVANDSIRERLALLINQQSEFNEGIKQFRT